jgi:triosephosphate isomerase (TIM)
MAHRPYIVGNWKMNGTRPALAEARAIDRAAARYPQVEVAIAPPFTLIAPLREAVSAIGVGGQDCSPEPKGAFTGDVSAAQLEDAGADFTIVGHSERRAGHGERDALVKAKAEAALGAGLGVILCVGETAEQRDSGRAEAIVAGQLDGSLPHSAGVQGAVPERFAVAYEPVWAIGTGRVASVADVVAMHAALRARLVAAYGEHGEKVRILYGGSVNAGNAADLLRAEGVGGALVGGASLTAEAFLPIVAACGFAPVD